MLEFRTKKIVVVLTCFAVLVSSCSSATDNESAISTAVAQTVQASDSLTKVVAISTGTLENIIPSATLTPAITPTSEPTLLSAPSNSDCIHASLVSEYPPDGTVYKPDTTFTKSWTIKNLGTCTWDANYQLIFWSGDPIGADASYLIPELVPPGDDITLSITMQAPPAEGAYVGYWRLKTPWNAVFGVGQYSQAFYVDILVDKKPNQEYGITDLTYNIVRDPAQGCPANVLYTVYATITTSGPYDMSYYWEQKDGNESAVKQLSFEEAGSKTISRTWMVGRGDSQNDRWMQVIVLTPEIIEFPKAVFENNCQ